MKLWLVGQNRNPLTNATEWQGIFDTEEKAISACRTGDYFICETELNKTYPHESGTWVVAWYPLSETKAEGSARMAKAQAEKPE